MARIFMIIVLIVYAFPARASSCTEEVGRGVASWYGPGFEGGLTKSEELFDPSDLSAAHPDLPMGTLVKVRNMRNDKAVIVKINDRGGFGHDRVIDVSEGAAKELGMIDDGTAAVSIFKCSR